jgi:hypothetical protein
MAKKPDDWLVTYSVSAERLKAKEDEGLGFFGWVGVILVVLIIIGALAGHH